MRYSVKYIGLILFLIIWLIVSSSGWVSGLIIPSPVSVIAAFWKMLGTEIFYSDIGISIFRVLCSLALSCLIGIPIGLLMGYKLVVYKTFIFLVDFFRSIPPIALFPVFILLFGLGESSKIAVPFYGCVLVVIVNSIYGVMNAPDIRKNVAKIYGFSDWQIFFKVVIPDAMPFILSGVRTAVSLAIVLTIVVEMLLGGKIGIGKRIYDSYLVFEIPQMFAMIILTGIIGYFFNQVFIYSEKKIFHWKS